MCGICGEIRFDSRPPDLGAVQRMTAAMTPRGPDGSGVLQVGPAAFGHRRLKIIDLSERASQPMTDPELGLSIVFNGAIYNYPELRKTLQGKGHRFFSNGDTEVILKAYAEWGKNCVQHLSGMFAFVIRERDSGRVFMARDRLGIKPLYYAERNGALLFASSLPALLAYGDIDTSIDPVALHYYLSFHAVVPAPWTLLHGVRKLPPASWMSIEPDGRRQQEEYWRPIYGPQPGDEAYGEKDWQDMTLEALRLAVKRRLVADVPVGVLLSGGLDSSLIVGLLAEAGQSGLHTFSVGFEDTEEEAGNEFQYSDIVAAHFATRHQQLQISGAGLIPALQGCVSAMSEPMVSHDAVGFYLLSEAVAKHVKVVQSGQGADEVFGGYHWYPPMQTSADPVADYHRVFCDRDHAEMQHVLQDPWLGEDHARNFVAEQFARPGASAAVDKALRMDTTVMLVDDPVKRVDNMTMAWGLEARVPFLDHDLVELAARIPAGYKLAQEGKGVLKEAARRVIPHAVIDRPKGYFPVPQLKYLHGETLDLVRGLLDSDAARQRGLFRRDYLDQLFADPKRHITPLRGSKLWQIALLEFWFQQQGL